NSSVPPSRTLPRRRSSPAGPRCPSPRPRKSTTGGCKRRCTMSNRWSELSEALSPEERAAVIRETFEAVTAVGFMKWKAEELDGWGYEVCEEDRQHYFREFEKDYFADFQKMAANASDARLLDDR